MDKFEKKMELSIIRCLVNTTAKALFFKGYEYNFYHYAAYTHWYE